jgi:hypothetical protein
MAEGIRTALGGALYLANLLTWLGLPHDWGDERLSHIGGWGIIEVLARALLGDQHASYAGDPLWGMLAALEGREPGIPVGAGAPALAAFRLRPHCLRLLGESKVVGEAVSGARRLTLSSPAGYAILDVPLRGRTPDVALDAELTPYRRAGLPVRWRWLTAVEIPRLCPSVAATVAPGCRRWFAHLARFAQEMLERMLGPTLTPGGALVRPARLAVSRTHVDLYMPLAQASIEVRRIGLDVDPGWMPDLGHIVLFHYVD